MSAKLLVFSLLIVALTALSCSQEQPAMPQGELGRYIVLASGPEGDLDMEAMDAAILDYFAENPPTEAMTVPAVDVDVEISQPPDGYQTEDECIDVVGTASAVGGAAIDLHQVLDTSGSLTITDPADFREQAAVALIQALNPAANIRVGTIDFDNSCSITSPLTLIGDDNGAAAIAAIQAMDQFGGTLIDCGITLAVNDFIANGRPGATWSILLFSDGESYGPAAVAAANYAAANNVIVNTIFLGAQPGGQLLMQQIAGLTGGFFLQTNDPQDLIDLFGTGPVTGIDNVTVNGQPATLAAGSFEANVCLACGENEITAVATATDDEMSQGSDMITVTRLCDIKVALDIKPTSCPNPLNPKSKGVVPVAILGTDDFDVSDIDPTTILLEGIAPIRWNTADVATPYYPTEGKADCMDCNELGPDGYMDLTLKFRTQDLVAALEGYGPGCVVLHLTGTLLDGTDITGEDVMRLKGEILPVIAGQ